MVLWQGRVGVPPDREANSSHYRRYSETDESLLGDILYGRKSRQASGQDDNVH